MQYFIWLIVLICFLALFQVRYYRKTAFKNLSYTRTISRDKVFEGERIELIESISNLKLTPLPWLRVESKISPWLRFKSGENLTITDEQFHKSIFFLRSYSNITRRHEIKCIRRGCYDLSHVSLSAGDLLGLDVFQKDVDGNAILYVYPTILSSEELSQDALRWQGDIIVKRWILPDPIMVNGLREYRSGDSQKDIHWKASARNNTLYVKTRDYTVSPRVLLVLNIDPQEQFWGYFTPEQADSLEYALRYIATFTNWAFSNGMEIGFYSNAATTIDSSTSISIKPACSAPHLEAILQTLACAVIKQHETFYRTVDNLIHEEPREMDILILTSFWNESLESRAKSLRAFGNSVTHMPFKREAVFYEADQAAG